MRRKLKGVLAVGLTLVMVLSLMVAFMPVASAADYEENDWGEWGLPSVEPDTDVGPMAVAPDGTLYAAVSDDPYITIDGTLSPDEWGSPTFSYLSDSAYLGTVNIYVTYDYQNLYIAAEADGGDMSAAQGMGLATALNIYIDSDNSDGMPDNKDIAIIASDDGLGIPFVPPQQGWDCGTYYTYTASGAGITIAADGDAYNGSGIVEVQIPFLLLGRAPSTIGLGFQAFGYTGYPDHPDWPEAYADFNLVTSLMKSTDGGYSWDDTELEDAPLIASIAVSPNYEEDETVYIGCAGGTVYRVEEAGEGDVIALKDIVDSEGTTASKLFSMAVWTDEDDYNWILVGTDLDVLVLKDKTFEDWRDQELATGGTTWKAYEVAFAPDFEGSDLIWAVVDDDDSAGTPDDFLVTATASPGKWGQDIGEVDLDIDASPFVDIGFPDDYDSDPDSGNTNLWVAVTSPGGGDIFLIEGVDEDDGYSNAIRMFTDIGGEDPADFASIAISGDYGDEVILAGELSNPTVWISDDGGYGWDEVDKNPTGEGMTYVIMEADVVWGGEAFDTDEGMAFAATSGAESAVSRANDGGQVFNQVGLIDTEIDEILNLGFHPDFPSDSIFLMITEDNDYGTTSLWLTENGDEDEPDYLRVLCGYVGSAPGNFDGEFYLVEYSQDASAIYIFGDDGDDNSIWKSTDDGQTFGKKRNVKDNAEINDWAITEDDTIYAATDKDGFYKTTNSGLSWSSYNVGNATNDIALSPDFEDDETILLGSTDGEVYMSDDDGDSFDETAAGLTGDVYVAFDADYADEDADGYTLIYAADDGGHAIQVGEVADTDDVDWDALEDDTNEELVTGDFFGLAVSSDNALYAIANTATYEGVEVDDEEYIGNWEDKTGVVRLLLHESDSIWEYADGLDEPEGLWLSAGSNVLWTIDGDELWVLEDTLSGQVTLDSPPDGYQSDRLEVIGIAWDEMRDADEYEWSLDETSGLGLDKDGTTDDTSVNISVTASSEYDWQVRVAPGEPWHSRWSDSWTFNTALGAAPWAPTLYTPGGEWQYSGLDVELMPAFSWQSAKNADGYQFVLADNAEFASPLVDDKVPESAYNLDFELEYNSNYFWKVMAYNGSKAISRWSDVGAFTTVTEEVPAPAPAPPATVTQPAPAPVVIPTPIPPVMLWTIVGIGALLIIAVIVLIVRTRRAV